MIARPWVVEINERLAGEALGCLHLHRVVVRTEDGAQPINREVPKIRLDLIQHQIAGAAHKCSHRWHTGRASGAGVVASGGGGRRVLGKRSYNALPRSRFWLVEFLGAQQMRAVVAEVADVEHERW